MENATDQIVNVRMIFLQLLDRRLLGIWLVGAFHKSIRLEHLLEEQTG
jgi:hypothetical protein